MSTTNRREIKRPILSYCAFCCLSLGSLLVAALSFVSLGYTQQFIVFVVMIRSIGLLFSYWLCAAIGLALLGFVLALVALGIRKESPRWIALACILLTPAPLACSRFLLTQLQLQQSEEFHRTHQPHRLVQPTPPKGG